MALIDYIDGPNRKIYLDSSTVNTEIHPIDIYKEMRTLRETDESLRKYDIFLKAYGYVEKGPGKYTERYVQEIDGTRIIPYDTASYITITGTIITDDGQEGINCFDRSGFTNAVDINYVPPQVEVLTIVTGSGVTEQDKADIIAGVWSDISGEIVKKMVFNKVTTSGNTITIYEDNGTDIWKQFDLTNDGRVEI